MSEASAIVIGQVLKDEGGVADVGDGKGVTRYGQTPQWLRDNGFDPPDSPAAAARNYQAWMDKYRLTDLANIDDLVGHFVVDDAVHAGETGAIKRLQTALGGVRVDGVLGDETLAAVAVADRRALAGDVLGLKLEQRGRLLASKDPDRRKYAKNWTHRIAEQIRALGRAHP